jgi:hypothetical protein
MNLKNGRKEYPDFMDDGGGVESFVVPNFQGKIGVVVKDEEGNFTTDFSLGDFIQHQIEGADVFLSFPEGTTIIPTINHNIPTDVLRDININKIIK